MKFNILLNQTFEDAERGIETVNNHIDGEADYASFLNVIYDNIKSANTVFNIWKNTKLYVRIIYKATISVDLLEKIKWNCWSTV